MGTKSFLVVVLFVMVSSSALIAQENVRTSQTFIFIGDAGEPEIRESTIGNVVKSRVNAAQGDVHVIYLGDNIYPQGMPPRDHPYRQMAEEIMKTQTEWIENTKATGIIIPGNHDWKRGHNGGWEWLLNQQAWIDSLNNEQFSMLPGDGCPGPVELPLDSQTVMVVIDSQWLLHLWDKPGEDGGCEAKTPEELATLISDILIRNSNKRIVFIAHHPIITYGGHGGVFGWEDHIFPLLHLDSRFYFPLPVIGSIFPLYRKWFGHIQDMKHPIYKQYSDMMQSLLKPYPGSIYVSGHDHALQFIVRDSLNFIVSGSGSKTDYAKKKGFAKYVEDIKGFVELNLHENGEGTLQYWQVDEAYPEGRVTYVAQLNKPWREDPVTANDSVYDFSNQYIKTRASSQYHAGKWRSKVLGDNYREVWNQEITVPVFDIGTEKGGLSIVKKGGGMQTLSLRLADSAGREYVLRSVEKYPEHAVPEVFRKTFAQDLVQDQISASHPYAALIVPGLANAAGIYHTNPEIVYVPDDPRLGVYRKSFANSLALFEERPDDDWSHAEFFGKSEKIISTSKVLQKLRKDNDNRVDEKAVLKARLFDMWIGDWDRHDDQWRWASFEEKKGELYKPIPRDRDQAFFVNEGWLPKVWSRKWSLPKFEGFDEAISWPSGLSFNARFFDRSFLTSLSEEDWIKTARELQEAMRDSVIDTALNNWPEPIKALSGEEVSRKLKARRESLVKNALEHYKFLAREVDVTGSDKHERFEVNRLPNGDVWVRIYKLSKDGDIGKAIFERLFKFHETNEVRLYSMDGNDEFIVTGTARRGIRVRMMGGEDHDRVKDDSHVGGWSKKNVYYDLKNSSSINSTGELKTVVDNNPSVITYDRTSFKYDRLAPLLYGNFNPDDGLFIGGGFLYQHHGFRKDPYKSRHIALASYAPRTNSYNLLYRGDFTTVVGAWNLEINADIKEPNFVNNFFGWGNESVFDTEIDERPDIDAERAIDFYRFRFEEIKLETFFSRSIGSRATFKIGPAFQRIEIEERDEDRFLNLYAEEKDYDILGESNNFLGVHWEGSLKMTNPDMITSRGIAFNVSGRTMGGLDQLAGNFSSFNSTLSFYHSFSLPSRLIFATRFGGGFNTGDYEFYQAQILDGKNELRGFRKTRFYGDARLFNNLEARVKLTSFRSYLFPASIGILAFHDIGRVWYKDETGIDPTAEDGNSSVWHQGWGGGVWVTPFNLSVVSAEVGHSNEGTLFYLRLGFLF